jgi:hypothetical protein
LHLVREWVSLVPWQDLEIIPSTPLKAWQDLVLQDLVPLALDLGPKVANSDQVDQDLVAPEAHVQDSVPQNLEWVAVLREVSQVVLQLAEGAAVLAAVRQVLLVKAEQEVKARTESQSAPREKNSNKEVFQVLVEQLFQEEMAQQ